MTDRNPDTLAREVLDVQKAHENLCKRTGLPLPTSMDDMETLANAAPTLALQVEAVEKELSEAEEWLKSEGIGTSYEYGMDEMIRRIRTALKGETND